MNDQVFLVANISGKARRDVLQGREHLVAPVTMIVPGVLNGLVGPLLYPESEIAKSVSAWNGIPLVLDHPMRNGKPISARDPQVLQQIGLGKVFNATANGKLSAEAWFDIENTRRIHPALLARLEAGMPIEVSTGLGADFVRGNVGVYNGRQYVAVATNYRPDHLAILPDGVGACSLKDQCGVFNEMRTMFSHLIRTEPNPQTLVAAQLVANQLVRNQGQGVFDPKDMLPVTVMTFDEPTVTNGKPCGCQDKGAERA